MVQTQARAKPKANGKTAGIRADSLSNVLSGLASELDWRTFTTIPIRPKLGRGDLDELYRTDHLVARIIDEPANDATRRWIEVKDVGADEQDEGFSKAVADALEGLRAQSALTDALRRDRKDGGALVILQVEDGAGEDLLQPLNLGAVKELRGLQVIDRWNATAGDLDEDPNSPTFDQPKWWTLITGKKGRETRIHASRVLAFRGIKISDKTMTEQRGFGENVVDRCWEPIRRFRHFWEYVETTAKNFSQTVLAIEGLTDLILNGREDAVKTRMRTFQAFRSTLKAVPIDAKDRLEEVGVRYEGVADLLRTAMDDIAAAAGMPVTKLFGHAPSGLSTDDESGRKNWQHAVAALQRDKLLDPLNYLLDILFASKAGPTKGRAPKRFQVDFLPLEEPSEQEIAERDYKKAQTDAIRVQTGVISADEARSRLLSDPRTPYILDLEREEEEEIATDPILGTAGAGAGPGFGGVEKAQDTALNGTQVNAVLEILARVAGKVLPRESGVAALVEFFNVEPARAERVMGRVGRDFFIEAPVPKQTEPQQLKPEP